MTTAVLHQDERTITLQMSLNRWKRLQKLEDTYKVANSINKANKQVDLASSSSLRLSRIWLASTMCCNLPLSLTGSLIH